MPILRRPRAEEILGEWGVRDVTPPSAREREQIEKDRELNPLRGHALPRRIRRFRPEADRYIASLGGPLPYMLRLRTIEEITEKHLERLTEAHARLLDEPAAWRRLSEHWDFGDVNELIERHNSWYPIEARLPMDPRSRDFVRLGGSDYRLPLLDASWIEEQFPPADPADAAS